jgi:phosphatidate cytidylyltransferase
MRNRWLTAAVGIPLFLGLCIWNATAFAIGVLVLAGLGLFEMVSAYWRAGIYPNPPLALLGLGYPAQVLLFLSRRDDWKVEDVWSRGVLDWVIPLLALAALWELALAARTGEMRAGRNLGYGLLCAVYVNLFGGLSMLRSVSNPLPARFGLHLDVGAGLLLVTVFAVWATDTFAFFMGRAMGRHKLAPALSPGKTVEGAIGGLVAGMLFGAIFGALLLHSARAGLNIGAIAGILGQIGDLFESALKREIGIKDFGGILPGHGGVLDRFDSLLFTGPAIYWLLVAFTNGGPLFLNVQP